MPTDARKYMNRAKNPRVGGSIPLQVTVPFMVDSVTHADSVASCKAAEGGFRLERSLNDVYQLCQSGRSPSDAAVFPHGGPPDLT